MPTLHIRNVPAGLYKRIQTIANRERRSVNAQVIALLEHAVARAERPKESMSAILERARALRESIHVPADWPGTLELLREDRRR